MTRTRTSVAITLAVLVFVSTVSLGLTVAQQASTATIETESTTPGVFTTHTVVVPIDGNSTGDVHGLRIDYGEADVDTGSIDDNRIEAFGIDRGGDEPGNRVDVRMEDDITTINSVDGGVLSIRVQGGRLARPGDEVVLSYRIENPVEEGRYTVNVTYNPETAPVQYTAMLRIGDAPTPEATPTFTPESTMTASPTLTATSTPTQTPSPTPMATPEPTPSPTPVETDVATTEVVESTTPSGAEQSTTETESPGFGVAGALLALSGVLLYGWWHTRRR